MDQLPKSAPCLAVRLRVQGHDCDASGWVSVRTYWHYYAVAENELYRRGGIKESDFPRRFGIVLPRLAAVNRFHAPAFLDDELEVRLWVTRLVSRSFTLHLEAWRLERGALCADGEITVYALRRSRNRLVRLPEALIALLGEYVTPAAHMPR